MSVFHHVFPSQSQRPLFPNFIPQLEIKNHYYSYKSSTGFLNSLFQKPLYLLLTVSCWGWHPSPHCPHAGWRGVPATTRHLRHWWHGGCPRTWSWAPGWEGRCPLTSHSQTVLYSGGDTVSGPSALLKQMHWIPVSFTIVPPCQFLSHLFKGIWSKLTRSENSDCYSIAVALIGNMYKALILNQGLHTYVCLSLFTFSKHLVLHK